MAETMAARCLKALGEYRGDDEWGDVIFAGDGWELDEGATDAVDSPGRSEVAIFADGSALAWDEHEKEWREVDPEALWPDELRLYRKRQAVRNATSITDLLALLDDEWYEAVEGEYTEVPTWGPETEAVQLLIGNGGPEGDLVSWDTRSPDPAEHVYLMRRLRPDKPLGQGRHVFRLMTHKEWQREVF